MLAPTTTIAELQGISLHEYHYWFFAVALKPEQEAAAEMTAFPFFPVRQALAQMACSTLACQISPIAPCLHAFILDPARSCMYAAGHLNLSSCHAGRCCAERPHRARSSACNGQCNGQHSCVRARP